MEFEWHPLKAKENLQKHGVSFSEASSVFADIFSETSYDINHSDDETRLLTIGMSKFARLLLVSHVERGQAMRIISARPLNKREVRQYQEGGL